ncbi:MAG: hypothetical protein Q7U10_06920, partial [Thermodesulfovibrionia bacterium]|nr:hypothetical protein [Thermodesulfovibrionia bacterium]
GNVTLAGTVTADTTTVAITAGNDITTSNTVIAQTNVTMTADEDAAVSNNVTATTGNITITTGRDMAQTVGTIQALVGGVEVVAGRDIDVISINANANNMTGGNAIKLTADGNVIVNVGGTGLIATGSLGLNIAIDPVDVTISNVVTATGDVDITASNNITVGAIVTADSDSNGTGNATLTADDDSSSAGDLTATVLITGENVDISGYNVTASTLTADRNASGTGNVTVTTQDNATLNAAVTAGQTSGTIDITATAGNAVTGAAGTLDAGGAITVDAGLDITLGATVDSELASVTLTSGNDTDINFTITAETGVTVNADNNVSIDANILADEDGGDDGDVTINADADNSSAGNVTMGNFTVYGDDITITGQNVQVDALTADNTGAPLVMTGAGDITVSADNNVTLNDTLTAGTGVTSNITITGTEGTVTQVGAGSDMLAGGSVAVTGGAGVDLNGTIGSGTIIGNNVTIASALGSIDTTGTIDAGQDVTMDAGQDVTVAGDVTAGGLIDIAGGHDVTITALLDTETNSGSTVDVTAGQDAVLEEINADGAVTLVAGRDMTFNNTVDADGADITATAGDDMFINANLGEDLTANNVYLVAETGGIIETNGATIDADFDITMDAGEVISLDGDVTAGDEISMLAGSDISMNGNNITAVTSVDMFSNNGAITSGALGLITTPDLNMGAATGIDVNTDVSTVEAVNTASGNVNIIELDTVSTNGLTIDGNGVTNSGNGTVTIDTPLDLTINAGISAGGDVDLEADNTVDINSSVTSLSGNVYVDSITDNVIVQSGAPVYAGQDIIVNAVNEIEVNDTLTAAAGDIELTSSASYIDVNIGGDMIAGGRVNVDANFYVDINNASVTALAGDVSMNADNGDVGLYSSSVKAGDYVSLDADSDVVVDDSVVRAGTSVYMNGNSDVFIQNGSDVGADTYVELYSDDTVEVSNGSRVDAGTYVDMNATYEVLVDNSDIGAGTYVTMYSDNSDVGLYSSSVKAGDYVSLDADSDVVVDDSVVRAGTSVYMNGNSDVFILNGSDVGADTYVELYSDDTVEVSNGSRVDAGTYVDMASTYEILVTDSDIGAGTDVTMSSDQTSATLTNATVRAGGLVDISAETYVDIVDSDIGADTDVDVYTNSSSIYIDNSVVSAGGHVDIFAANDYIYMQDTLVRAGEYAAVAAASGAGSVDIYTSDINAGEGVDILSVLSYVNIDSTPITAGTYVGITANTSVDIIGSTIDSSIGSGTYTEIYSNNSYVYLENAPIAAGTYVNIVADDELDINASSITANSGNISLTSYFDYVDAYSGSPLLAGGSVDITAGSSIWTQDKVTAATGYIDMEANSGDIDVDGDLSAGDYVELTAYNSVNLTGNINAGGYVDIDADDDVNIDADITVDGSSTINITADSNQGGVGNLNIAQTAASSITSIDGDITLQGEDINVGAGANTGVVRTVGNGDIKITADYENDLLGGDFTLDGTESEIDSGGSIDIDPPFNVTIGGDGMHAEHDIDIDAVNDIEINAAVNSTMAGNITMTAGNDILLSDEVRTTTTGDVSLTATLGVIDDADAGTEDEYVAGDTVTMTAANGIGITTSDIDTQANTILANTTATDVAAGIDIENTNSGSTNVTLATVSAGQIDNPEADITFQQTGGGGLKIDSATTTDGSIMISNVGASATQGIEAVIVSAGDDDGDANSGLLSPNIINPAGGGDVKLYTDAGGMILRSVLAEDDIEVIADFGDISIDVVGIGPAITLNRDVYITATNGFIDELVTAIPVALPQDAAVDITGDNVYMFSAIGIGKKYQLEVNCNICTGQTTSSSGDINILDPDDHTANYQTVDGSITITAGGYIDVILANAQGLGKDVTLTSTGTAGTDPAHIWLDEVYADDDIFVTASDPSGGNIYVGDVGDSFTDDITMTATFGSIYEHDGSPAVGRSADALTDLVGDEVSLTALNDIGGTGEDDIEMSIRTLMADSTLLGDIILTELDDDPLLGDNGIDLLDVDTNDGDIILVTNGLAFETGRGTVATDVRSDTGVAGTHDVSIDAQSGDMEVNYVQSDDDIFLGATAAGGRIVEFNTTDQPLGDLTSDIVGDTLMMQAGAGIGTDDSDRPENRLDTDVNFLAATTLTGDINIQNDGALATFDASGAGIPFGNGTLIGPDGVSITGPGGSDGDNITIIASSPFTVTGGAPVLNAVGGDILLVADGITAADDMTINDTITASGGNGNITLYAGDDVYQNDDVTATGSGNISIYAGVDYNSGTPHNGNIDGVITMADGTETRSGSGDITLEASGDVSISSVVSANKAAPLTFNTDLVLTAQNYGNSGNVGLIIFDMPGWPTIDVSLSGSNVIIVTANISGGLVTNAAIAAAINLDPGASALVSASGGVTIAVAQFPLPVSLSGGDALGDITITADSDGPQGNLSNGIGAIIDNLTGEAANIIGDDLVMSAATGIGSADDIETDVTTVLAANSTSGHINIYETNGLDNDLVVLGAANLTAGAGNVNIQTEDGTLTINGAVSTAGAASTITLIAGDAATSNDDDLNVNAAVTAVNGTVTLTSVTNDVNFAAAGDVTTTSGYVDVNAMGVAGAGKIFMADGALIDAGDDLITMDAQGDITIGGLKTNYNTAGNVAVYIETVAGAVIDGGDTDVDIDVDGGVNSEVVISAETGIGTDANGLETSIDEIAATTDSGDIHIINTGDLEIVNSLGDGGAGAAEVRPVGVTITDSANNDSGDDNITITAASPLTVSADVLNSDGGDITLSALGTATTDDLAINANVRSTYTVAPGDGGGNILLTAGDTVTISNSYTVQAQGTGSVTIIADSDGDEDGSGGAVTMSNGSLVDADSGRIFVSADEDITLGGLLTTNATNATGQGAVELTSTSAGIVDGGDVFVNVNAANGRLLTQTVTGVGRALSATGGAANDAIETTVLGVEMENTASGNIDIAETDAMNIYKIVQMSPEQTDNNGFIRVVTTNGTITVVDNSDDTEPVIIAVDGSGVSEGGSVRLTAGGGNSDVVINDGITTEEGNVTITANDSVFFGNTEGGRNGFISSPAEGNVTIIANANGTAAGDSGDLIFMANGATIDAGSGFISMTASSSSDGGNITLTGLKTTSASNTAVTIVSDSAVIDGGDTNIDIDANNGRVVIDAVTGVGNVSGAGADVAIETSAGSLDIENLAIPAVGKPADGDINIDETDNVTVIQLDNDDADEGDIRLITAGSTITIADESVGGLGVVALDGDILLDANGSAGSIISYAEITTGTANPLDSAGDHAVQILANDHVAFMDGTADVTSWGEGSVTVTANSLNNDSGFGSVTMHTDSSITADDITISGFNVQVDTLTADNLDADDNGTIDIDAVYNVVLDDNLTAGRGSSSDINITATEGDVTQNRGDMQAGRNVDIDGREGVALYGTIGNTAGPLSAIGSNVYIDSSMGSVDIIDDITADGSIFISAANNIVVGGVSADADITADNDLSDAGNVYIIADSDSSTAGDLTIYNDSAVIGEQIIMEGHNVTSDVVTARNGADAAGTMIIIAGENDVTINGNTTVLSDVDGDIAITSTLGSTEQTDGTILATDGGVEIKAGKDIDVWAVTANANNIDTDDDTVGDTAIKLTADGDVN